ncbi:MAG: DUF1467 family protein [Pseudomonadota bacterium]
MGITSALVLFAVIWWMVFFVVLPLRLRTQGEDGEVVPGTPEGAPNNLNMRRKVRMTTLWSFGIWVIVAGVILTETVTVRDFDFMGRLDGIEAR